MGVLFGDIKSGEVGFPHTTGISPKGISYKPTRKPRIKRQKVPLAKTQLQAKQKSRRKTKKQIKRIWHKII